jgi:hypothetical protein
MGCYEMLPSQPAAAAAVADTSSSTCILWTGGAGGELVQHYQQYLQAQLQHPGNGNGSFADGAAHPADRYSIGDDVEQPSGLLAGGLSQTSPPAGFVNRQQSTTAAALAGLRRNSSTLAGLGLGISSKHQYQQQWRKGSGSSSRRVAAVRRPQGWWQQLMRGVFGIGVVEKEPLHAGR